MNVFIYSINYLCHHRRITDFLFEKSISTKEIVLWYKIGAHGF